MKPVFRRTRRVLPLLLAASLGLAKQWLGGERAGFLLFAALAVLALASLTTVKHRWRATWGAALEGVRI